MSVLPAESNVSMAGTGILGRNTSGAGKSARLSAAQLRTLCSVYSTSEVDTLLGSYQPLDGDLTAIAALTTTTFGRSLLTQADAAAVRSTIGAGTSSFDGAFSSLTGTPTTISGFGITNAYTKTEVDNLIAGLLDFKGNLDCSTNPNYPSASKGDAYYCSVAGKVGGASGTSVDVGDTIVASADNAGGTQASVGTSWFVLEHNLAGALVASNNLSDLASASTARTNLGLGTLATQNGTFSGTSSGTNTGDQDLSGYLLSSTAASTYVPYTGATTNVNIGSNSLTAGAATFSGDSTIRMSSVLTFAKNSNRVNLRHTVAPTNIYYSWDATGGFVLGQGNVLQFAAGDPNVGGDVILARDAAGILAQRNGVNAQQFNLYGTYTSATNREYLKFRGVASANFEIGPANGSAGGTLRGLTIGGYTNDSSTITPWLTFTNAGAATFSSTVTCITELQFGSSDDTVIRRVSAGLLEINNGTAGTYRDLVLRNLRMSTPTVPATSSDTGSEGQVSWDTDYIYVCTATNTWKRAALSTF